jgi:hypothetical protein
MQIVFVAQTSDINLNLSLNHCGRHNLNLNQNHCWCSFLKLWHLSSCWAIHIIWNFLLKFFWQPSAHSLELASTLTERILHFSQILVQFFHLNFFNKNFTYIYIYIYIYIYTREQAIKCWLYQVSKPRELLEGTLDRRTFYGPGHRMPILWPKLTLTMLLLHALLLTLQMVHALRTCFRACTSPCQRQNTF